jgi:hypothetical protein
MKLYDFQRVGVNRVMSKWQQGITRVCFVLPTGGGKSVCGAEWVRRARASGAKVLAIAHRRELVSQLLGHFGSEAAAICPGFDRRPDAPIQVATIQTLLASGIRPEAQMLLWDECHHVPSDEWQQLLHDYEGVRTVGLTATPSRSDGRALGDLFDDIVVGAQYSDLLRDGYLVPVRVFQATNAMGADLALDPVQAIQKHGGGSAFVFTRDVNHASDVAIQLNQANISAAVICHDTPADVRAEEISRFRRGWLDALVNVYTLTEGVDIPDAKTCVLARSVSHPSTYLQMVGRIMRCAPGKKEGILIDLTGASLMHGLPTEDRDYSLCGKPISKKSLDGLRVCLQCGYTYYSQGGACPSCGFVWTNPKPKIKIYTQELREVFAGIDTPSDAKHNELQRLTDLVDVNSWSLGWALKQYKKLFNEAVPVWKIPLETRQRWFEELAREGKKRGYKQGYAAARYRGEFGCWPEWR